MGWVIFTYEKNIPVCYWINTHECEKIPCVVDERLCGDTFLRVERISKLKFVVSDIWMYNSNCVFACSTFRQRYNWLQKLLPLCIQEIPGFAQFVHKSNLDTSIAIRGAEEYPEEIGKPGYYVENDNSDLLQIVKLNIPDCYEVVGKGYLRVPDLKTSKYLRSKGSEFKCRCIPFDEEFWDIVENIPELE